jgi:hypothetical protein
MFSNRESGWKMTQKLNQGGPKTKAEVQQEVQDKRDKEDAQRGGDRRYNNRDGYGGGGNYNDRNDNRRDGGNNRGDRRDNNRGDNRYQKKDTGKFQQKDRGQEGQYGKGGRENRDGYRADDRKNKDRRDDKPREIIELDDNEMGSRLKKNFEDFVIYRNNQGQRDEAEEGAEEKKTETHDLSVYRKLQRENGKQYDQMFFSLLCNVFDEDLTKVEAHFDAYLDQLISQKLFKSQNYSEGVSKFLQYLPELVLDLP